MQSEAERIAKGLSAAQRRALNRLARAYVWIDGRSKAALVRRGLAKSRGDGRDALIGKWEAVVITPIGLAVREVLLKTPDA